MNNNFHGLIKIEFSPEKNQHPKVKVKTQKLYAKIYLKKIPKK